MSNSNQRKQPGKNSDLLDELGSIKELLDEELDNPPSYNSVAEIASVKEYLRIKKAAEAVNLSVEEYLRQQTETRERSQGRDLHEQSEAASKQVQEVAASEDHENAIPLLEEVIPSDEAIPLLVEATPPEEVSGNTNVSLAKIEQVVDILVNHRLERLRPLLKKEVMDELHKLLPLDALKKQ